MHSNLMSPPGDGLASDQCPPVVRREQAKAGQRFLAGLAIHGHAARSLLWHAKRQITLPLLHLRHTFDHRHVNLVHLMPREALGKRSDGPLALRQQKDPGRVCIQPMHVPQKANTTTARPHISRNDASHQQRMEVVDHPVCVLRRQHPTGRLVDRQHRPVLMQHGNLEARQADFFECRHVPQIKA